MESVQTRGERTRQAILDSAREIILSQGYTAASMREIGQAAGITPAAIYNHFESKEALFSCLLEESVPVQEASALLQGLAADSAEELLAVAFRGLVDLLRRHEDYIRLALIDAQERDGATLVTYVPALFSLLGQLIDRLQALDSGTGRLRTLPPQIVARSLASLIIGYILTERVGRPQQFLNLAPTDWESGLLDVLMYGLFLDE